MTPKIGIVLVNYNGEKFQNDCVRSIKDSTYKNYEVIVVDNGSSDNSVSMLRKEFPEVIIIETKENCGVAKGNNIGINYALESNCEYVLLLNNDTEIDRNLLACLVEVANEKTLVTSKMYYFEPKDLIWCAGGKFNWISATTKHFGEDTLETNKYSQSCYVDYTPTCCLLVHRNVFEDIGLMDENYFMYYDDTDFCLRAKKAGYRLWYESKGVLWHKVSSSSGGKTSKTSIYYGTRNRLYYIDKFYDSFWKKIPKTYFYLTRFIKLFILFLKKDHDLIKITLKALSDYNKKKMGIIKE